MPRLKDLRFGELAAESDDRLFDYFVVTPVAERIVTKNVSLVIGRKGSGKTALFRQAEALLQRFDHDHVKVIRLNMDDHAWEAFRDFHNLGLSREHAATVSWQLALLLQLCLGVIGEPMMKWSKTAAPDVGIIRKFIEDNFGAIKPGLAKSRKLIGQFSGLKVGAFGATLEAQFKGEVDSPRDLVPSLTDAISQHLVAPLAVLPGQVGQPADRWETTDGGVGPVVVVLVQPPG